MITAISSAVSEARLRGLTRVVSGSFSDGWGLGNMSDINCSKELYFSRYASELGLTKEEFQRLISSIATLYFAGTTRGYGRLSAEGPKDENSLRKVQPRTDKADISCPDFYENYKDYYELISKIENFNFEAFAEVLSGITGGKISTQNSRPKATENDAQEIYDVIRSAMLPMSCEKVHKKLWHIPTDTIKKYLSNSRPDEFVRTGRDTYFYAPNFPASPEELEQIKEIIATQLKLNSFITVEELRALIKQDMPYISLENFNALGLSNSLGFILKANFSFNGAVISSLSNPMNMDAVFKDFCNSRDELSMRELESFADEVNSSNIRWHAVLGIMLRVSESRFVKNNQIGFPITKVDLAINDLLGDSDYRPLKDLDIFVHFPDVGYSWNRHLLESYITGYSWRFKLIHTGYSKKEGYTNAVVTRRSGRIKSFKDLLTTVLANSGSWHTRNEALNLLTGSGYLSNQKFAGINYVISGANALRKKHGFEI